jgi:hypothetical protein
MLTLDLFRAYPASYSWKPVLGFEDLHRLWQVIFLNGRDKAGNIHRYRALRNASRLFASETSQGLFFGLLRCV